MARIISWSYWCTDSIKDGKDYSTDCQRNLLVVDTARVANAGGGPMECRW